MIFFQMWQKFEQYIQWRTGSTLRDNLRRSLKMIPLFLFFIGWVLSPQFTVPISAPDVLAKTLFGQFCPPLYYLIRYWWLWWVYSLTAALGFFFISHFHGYLNSSPFYTISLTQFSQQTLLTAIFARMELRAHSFLYTLLQKRKDPKSFIWSLSLIITGFPWALIRTLVAYWDARSFNPITVFIETTFFNYGQWESRQIYIIEGRFYTNGGDDCTTYIRLFLRVTNNDPRRARQLLATNRHLQQMFYQNCCKRDIPFYSTTHPSSRIQHFGMQFDDGTLLTVTSRFPEKLNTDPLNPVVKNHGVIPSLILPQATNPAAITFHNTVPPRFDLQNPKKLYANMDEISLLCLHTTELPPFPKTQHAEYMYYQQLLFFNEMMGSNPPLTFEHQMFFYRITMNPWMQNQIWALSQGGDPQLLQRLGNKSNFPPF